MEKVKIYCLLNTKTEQVFYIGCTKQRLMARLSGHVNCRLQSRKGDFIYDIYVNGGKVEIMELDEVNIEDGQFWEQHYIDLFFSFGFNLIQRRKSEYNEAIRHRSKGQHFHWSKRGRKALELNPHLEYRYT